MDGLQVVGKKNGELALSQKLFIFLLALVVWLIHENIASAGFIDFNSFADPNGPEWISVTGQEWESEGATMYFRGQSNFALIKEGPRSNRDPALAFVGGGSILEPNHDKLVDGDSAGVWFIRDEAGINIPHLPPIFVVEFQEGQNMAGISILDIDSDATGETESWIIEAVDANGIVIESIFYDPLIDGDRDLMSTAFEFNREFADILQLHVRIDSENPANDNHYGYAFDNITFARTSVPEASSMLTLGFSVVGFFFYRQKSRKKQDLPEESCHAEPPQTSGVSSSQDATIFRVERSHPCTSPALKKFIRFPEKIRK